MQTVVIEGTLRTDLGKKASAQARKAGNVPCVVYAGAENIHFTAPLKAFRHLVYTPDFKVAEIVVNGKTHRALVKEVQYHPLTDVILHIDFLELTDGKSFKADIPVTTVGVSEGVKLGVKLIQKVRKVKIKTTPEKLVDALKLDISTLELGKSLRVRDINLQEGIEVLNNGSIPLATVEIPRALRQAQQEAANPSGGKKK